MVGLETKILELKYVPKELREIITFHVIKMKIIFFSAFNYYLSQ